MEGERSPQGSGISDIVPNPSYCSFSLNYLELLSRKMSEIKMRLEEEKRKSFCSTELFYYDEITYNDERWKRWILIINSRVYNLFPATYLPHQQSPNCS